LEQIMINMHEKCQLNSFLMCFKWTNQSFLIFCVIPIIYFSFIIVRSFVFSYHFHHVKQKEWLFYVALYIALLLLYDSGNDTL
jgi:hypothetical protein